MYGITVCSRKSINRCHKLKNDNACSCPKNYLSQRQDSWWYRHHSILLLLFGMYRNQISDGCFFLVQWSIVSFSDTVDKHKRISCRKGREYCWARGQQGSCCCRWNKSDENSNINVSALERFWWWGWEHSWLRGNRWIIKFNKKTCLARSFWKTRQFWESCIQFFIVRGKSSHFS